MGKRSNRQETSHPSSMTLEFWVPFPVLYFRLEICLFPTKLPKYRFGRAKSTKEQSSRDKIIITSYIFFAFDWKVARDRGGLLYDPFLSRHGMHSISSKCVYDWTNKKQNLRQNEINMQ